MKFEVKEDYDLKESVGIAMQYREKQARTFRTKVGVCLDTFDGKKYGGQNMETYYLDGTLHAERTALIRALSDGYNGTDFKRMTVVFQDPGHKDVEVFPACPSCWMYLWDMTHPYLDIVNATTSGEVYNSTKLKDVFGGVYPENIYPSVKTRMSKPRTNNEPVLKLDPSLKGFYNEDEYFRGYCDEVLNVKKDPAN